MGSLKVYKYIVHGRPGSVYFIVAESAINAEVYFIKNHIDIFRLVDFKDLDEVDGAPNECGIWFAKKLSE